MIEIIFLSFLAFAQSDTEIELPPANPCFMNYTSSVVELWKSCGVEDDWLNFLVVPWEWVTGGLFAMIFMALMIWTTWMKYHNALYAFLIGSAFLPVSYALFPEQFVGLAIVMGFFALGVAVWWAFVRQTRETS